MRYELSAQQGLQSRGTETCRVTAKADAAGAQLRAGLWAALPRLFSRDPRGTPEAFPAPDRAGGEAVLLGLRW